MPKFLHLPRERCSCSGSSTRNTVCLGTDFALDHASVVADDLGNQCKTQAGPGAFRCHERVEKVGFELFPDAGAVVLDLDHHGQADAGAAAGQAEPHARPERGAQRDASTAPDLPGSLRPRS